LVPKGVGSRLFSELVLAGGGLFAVQVFGRVLLRVHLEYVRDDGVDLDVADQPREEYLLDDVTLQRP